MAYQRQKRIDRQAKRPALGNASPSKPLERRVEGGGALTKFTPQLRVCCLDERGVVDISHNVAVPAGFIKGKFATEEIGKAGEGKENKMELVKQSAMAVARAPVQQLFMTCFMLWMSGSTLQIFSIMMLSMAIWTPVQALFTVNKVFERFLSSGVDLTLPKLIYIAINLAGIGVGLYKLHNLGLLPKASDWMGDAPLRTALQHTASPLL
eukprot:g7751.t1